MTHRYERIPYLVMFEDASSYRDTYGGTGEQVALECYLLKPDRPSDTVLVFMHPIGGGAYLPINNALARAGHHVIYANSRYRGADYALVMEKVVEDLGAAMRDARERLGYKNVVLAGWSGGGSLSVYYQQQARHATITSSPAGEPPDLTTLDLQPADALLMLATHVSRHRTLTEWMDASIVDELDPFNRDPELDLYNPDGPVQALHTEEFVARYRAAQEARNRRITAWVKERRRPQTGGQGAHRARVRRARDDGRPSLARPRDRPER
jgi:pimeloyl-ACP methyl ester carboxylesterase